VAEALGDGTFVARTSTSAADHFLVEGWRDRLDPAFASRTVSPDHQA
jgi:hypothetical protein